MFPRANLSETFGILFNLFTEAERLKSANGFFIAIKRNWFLCGRPGHKYLCPSLPSTQHQIEQKDVSRTSFDICRDHLDSLWGCGDQAILIWKFHSQPALISDSVRYEWVASLVWNVNDVSVSLTQWKKIPECKSFSFSRCWGHWVCSQFALSSKLIHWIKGFSYNSIWR